MGEELYRQTWAEVDLAAIKHNIEQIKKKLPPTSQVTAVVKADGYGHGSVKVAEKALESGATSLAVALLEEALVLRRAGIKVPILVMNCVPPEAAIIAAEQEITLTFFQEDWLHQVNQYTLEKDLHVHMKWDTGMGRIGIRTDSELKQLLHALNQSKHIHLTGVYTHLATADDTKDMSYYYRQQERFDEMIAILKQLWSDPVTIHIGNSAGSIQHPNNMYHTIRFGIAMYGLYPSLMIKDEKMIDLKQAFSLYTRLIHVKEMNEGDIISYGGTYEAEEGEWIGTVPIGYGDGWIRKLQNAEVLIEGKRFPIVGRICMDQMMIHLDKKYPVGTKVTLIGEQMGEVIDMDEIAIHLETISYEIPCMINERVPRLYIDSDEKL